VLFFIALLQITLGEISKWRFPFVLKTYLPYKVGNISFFTTHSALKQTCPRWVIFFFLIWLTIFRMSLDLKYHLIFHYNWFKLCHFGRNLTEVMLCSPPCILLSTILICLMCGGPSDHSWDALEGLSGLSMYSQAHSQDSLQGKTAKHRSRAESQGSFQEEFSAVESHKTHWTPSALNIDMGKCCLPWGSLQTQCPRF